MREIKFRGKHIISQKWIYGDLIHEEWIGGKPIMIKHKKTAHSVLEDTIGQYTGLHDKNGKEIYEGDIVKKLIWNELKFEAEGDGQEYCYAKVMYIEELAGFYLVNRDNKILWEVSEDKYNIEVTGNIYDNPELLKGEQS